MSFSNQSVSLTPTSFSLKSCEDIDNKANLLGEKYIISRTLEIGTYDEVKLAKNINADQEVAIKIYDKQKIRMMNREHQVLTEIKIMNLLSHHHHIIKLLDLIRTEDDIYLVMEHAHSTLYDYVFKKNNGRLKVKEARRIFLQIVDALEYIHDNNVIHRDIKLENILLDSENNVKISNFSISEIKMESAFPCTPKYAAPEIIKPYDSTVDIWSCGVLLYVMLCGTFPFDDAEKVKSGNFNFPDHVDYAARYLITRMLMVDSAKRIKVSEIKDQMWFY